MSSFSVLGLFECPFLTQRGYEQFKIFGILKGRFGLEEG